MRLSLLLAFLLLNLACSNNDGLHSAFEDLDEPAQETVTPGVSPVSDSTVAVVEDSTALIEDTSVEIVEEVPVMPEHLRIALEFADDPLTEALEGGVVEDPGNRSPDIDRWLSAVLAEPFYVKNGVEIGHSYCAAFVSWCLTQAGDVKMPRNRSAGARTFIDNGSFEADMCAQSLALNNPDCNTEVDLRIVMRGITDIRPGTMAIWKRKRNPEDWQGHIGFVDRKSVV